MNPTHKPARKLIEDLLENDPFSQWLGIELLDIQKGKASVGMTVRKEMVNGFSVAHGAIPYALADTALAFASNSRNKLSLTMNNHMTYLRKIESGDRLVARANELSLHKSYAVYKVSVERSDNIRLAVFRGTVYRSDRLVSNYLSQNNSS